MGFLYNKPLSYYEKQQEPPKPTVDVLDKPKTSVIDGFMKFTKQTGKSFVSDVIPKTLPALLVKQISGWQFDRRPLQIDRGLQWNLSKMGEEGKIKLGQLREDVKNKTGKNLYVPELLSAPNGLTEELGEEQMKKMGVNAVEQMTLARIKDQDRQTQMQTTGKFEIKDTDFYKQLITEGELEKTKLDIRQKRATDIFERRQYLSQELEKQKKETMNAFINDPQNVQYVDKYSEFLNDQAGQILDANKLTAEDILDVYHFDPDRATRISVSGPNYGKMFLEKAKEGFFSGLLKSEMEPETFGEQVMGILGQSFGGITSLILTGNMLKGAALLTKTGQSFKATKPFLFELFGSVGAFNAQGQLGHGLSGDFLARTNTMLWNTTMAGGFSVVNSVFGGISAWGAQAGMGYGLSKLSGESNTEAVISAIVFMGLHGTQFIKPMDVGRKLMYDSRKLLKEKSGETLKDRYIDEDVIKIGNKALKNTLSPNEIEGINFAVKFLTKDVPMRNREFPSSNPINNIKKTIRQVREELGGLVGEKIKFTENTVEENLSPSEPGKPKIDKEGIRILLGSVKTQPLTKAQIEFLKSEKGKSVYHKRMEDLKSEFYKSEGKNKRNIGEKIDNLTGLGKWLGYEGPRITDIRTKPTEIDAKFAMSDVGSVMQELVDKAFAFESMKPSAKETKQILSDIRKTVSDVAKKFGFTEQEITQEFLRGIRERQGGKEFFREYVSPKSVKEFLKNKPSEKGFIVLEKAPREISQFEPLVKTIKEKISTFKTPEERSNFITETIKKEYPQISESDLKQTKSTIGKRLSEKKLSTEKPLTKLEEFDKLKEPKTTEEAFEVFISPSRNRADTNQIGFTKIQNLVKEGRHDKVAQKTVELVDYIEKAFFGESISSKEPIFAKYGKSSEGSGRLLVNKKDAPVAEFTSSVIGKHTNQDSYLKRDLTIEEHPNLILKFDKKLSKSERIKLAKNISEIAPEFGGDSFSIKKNIAIISYVPEYAKYTDGFTSKKGRNKQVEIVNKLKEKGYKFNYDYEFSSNSLRENKYVERIRELAQIDERVKRASEKGRDGNFRRRVEGDLAERFGLDRADEFWETITGKTQVKEPTLSKELQTKQKLLEKMKKDQAKLGISDVAVKRLEQEINEQIKREKPSEVIITKKGVEEMEISKSPELEKIETELERLPEEIRIKDLSPEERKSIQKYFEEEGIATPEEFRDLKTITREEYVIAIKSVREIERELGQDVEKAIGEITPPIGLATKRVKQTNLPDEIKGLEFSNSEVEKNYQRARGVKPEGLIQKIKNKIKDFLHIATRTYPDLPNIPEFAEFRNILDKTNNIKEIVNDRAIRSIQGITIEIPGPNKMDLFNRKILLDDLAMEAKAGRAVPMGFSEFDTNGNLIIKHDLLNIEKTKIDKLVFDNPDVARSVAKRDKMWKAIGQELVDYKILRPEQLKENYFRHQVLEYANAKSSTIKGTGPKFGEKKPSYAKKRQGTVYDINTHYHQAELEIMSQALHDIEIAKSIKKIEKLPINIRPQLSKEAKEKGIKDWHDLIPEGYTTWQPKEGNRFYTVYTIPERIVNEVVDQVNKEFLNIDKDIIHKGLAIGGLQKEFVLPEGVVKTLNNLYTVKQPEWVTEIATQATKRWKQWVLLNPRRFFKYNWQNFIGDSDAVIAANSSIFKRLPQAFKELYAVFKENAPMTEPMKDFFERGGLSNVWTVQELPNVQNIDVFNKFYKETPTAKTALQKANIFKKYWQSVQKLTRFRESLLRYAAYLDYVERFTSNKNINYGASNRKIIDALKDPKDKASKVATELLGDYANITAMGKGLRSTISPFFSWIEINTKRYPAIIRNAWQDSYSKGATTTTRTMGLIGVKGSWALTKVWIRMVAMTGLVSAYNQIFHSDAEGDLSEYDAGRMHINLGYDKDGNVRILRGQGAFSDLIDWFGLGQVPLLWHEYFNKKASLSDLFGTIPLINGRFGLKPIVEKFLGSVTPAFKVPYELLSGKTFPFEDFQGFPIEDKLRQLTKYVQLENEYDWIFQKPSKGYIRSWGYSFITEIEPLESAYRYIQSEKHKYLALQGKGGTSDYYTPRSIVYRSYRKALKYKDKDAEDKAWNAMAKLGVTYSDIDKMLESSDPLMGLSKNEKNDFINNYLSQKDYERYKKAVEYYEKTFRK